MKTYKKNHGRSGGSGKAYFGLSTIIVILILTVGNVFSRKIIHRSWSFTEELVVAVFVLITLMAAALSARRRGEAGESDASYRPVSGEAS